MTEPTMVAICGGLFIASLGWAVWRVETMLHGRWGDAVLAHTRVTDALNATRARIDRLKDIASNQQSVKSRRIIAVLEGDQ
ncbi:hypothetical protein [Sphingopyxis sp. JAI128]|uniref:hypothetical protein n=1 Tax=Sphingopyxis sp. JAI128 TaxID=2723066 RepID=UPI00161F6B8E|nr:hypothetical protein [Sphingopyxis sp. JAI128]MBB6424977.1 hypothetical protein [Sphingopyxis sp. JAI128]